MFDIGFFELVVVAVVGLVVLGPERMPPAIRAVGLGLAYLRRSWSAMKGDIERELKIDELRQDIHNTQIMGELQRESDSRSTADAQESHSGSLPQAPQAGNSKTRPVTCQNRPTSP